MAVEKKIIKMGNICGKNPTPPPTRLFAEISIAPYVDLFVIPELSPKNEYSEVLTTPKLKFSDI